MASESTSAAVAPTEPTVEAFSGSSESGTDIVEMFEKMSVSRVRKTSEILIKNGKLCLISKRRTESKIRSLRVIY